MRENRVRTIWKEGGAVVNGWLAIPNSFSAEAMDVAMVMLSIGSWAYGLYVAAYTFKSAAGAAGSVFLGLVFIYYAALILLYGIEIMKKSHERVLAASPNAAAS